VNSFGALHQIFEQRMSPHRRIVIDAGVYRGHCDILRLKTQRDGPKIVEAAQQESRSDQ
jgi:hypothetical protein